MKPSELQQLAREFNWLLFQIKGAKGNIIHNMRKLNISSASIEGEFNYLERTVKEIYEFRKDKLLLAKEAQK